MLGKLPSTRRAFTHVLLLGRCDGLPLHIGRQVSPVGTQRDDVVYDIAWAGAGGAPGRWAGRAVYEGRAHGTYASALIAIIMQATGGKRLRFGAGMRRALIMVANSEVLAAGFCGWVRAQGSGQAV